MSRLARRFRFALAGLAGGLAVTCSAPTEAPPLGPRPEPVQPAPSPTDPVPGAPSPIDDDPPAPLDGGVSSVTAIEPVVLAPAPKQKVPIDAGVADAPPPPPPPPDAPPPRDAGLPLPPIADGGLPADASRRAD